MNAILLPLLLPFVGAIVCLFGRNSLAFNRIVSGIVTVALPIVSFWLLYKVRTEGVIALRVGDWPAQFGIVFVLDLFGAIMLCLASITQLASWLFVVSGGVPARQEEFLLHPMFLLLGAGVNWAFSTGDLFNLFVSFEIILLASYVLLVHGNERAQVREAYKYVVLNILASTLFLATAGYTYGVFGSLNLADLAIRIGQAGYPPQALVIGTLLLVTFGIKSALFPLFTWLPDSYPTAPDGIVAYFSGILTKVGVYCLYRVFTLLFQHPSLWDNWFAPIVLAVGALTMIVGVLCALSQWTMKRILSFHIVSQIGYMIFGLGLFTVGSIGFGIFYIVHHIIVKASLFLVAGAVKVNEGSQSLKKVHGLLAVYPGLATLYLLAALSLAGIPPLSGFFGKYGLIIEGINEEKYFYVAVSLITSLLTLMSMIKIWKYIFWGKRDESAPKEARNKGVIAATGMLVAVSLLVAIFSGPIMNLAYSAGEQLLSREDYVHAVLGERGVTELRAHSPEVRE